MYKITLVADKKKGNLTKQLVEEIASKSKAERFEILEEGIAAKLFNAENIPASNDFDVIAQAADAPRIKLLLCDMESTIISNEFLDEIADHLGIGSKVAEITERAMNGELNFEESLAARIGLVKGLAESEIKEIIKAKLKYNDGAHELIKWCRNNGVYTMLVSGGFTAFTSVVAKELGFHEHHANTLLFDNGKLSGVGKPILGKEAKLDFLQKKSSEMKISLLETAAMGDGANDLPMLKSAGLGIGYKAKPKVKEEIKNQINYSNLAALKFIL